MRPGEIVYGEGTIPINAGRRRVTLRVRNTSRWPVQVSSHFHFFEVNRRLAFDRARAFGMRLDIPAGGGIRWAPGEVREVPLVPLAGTREAWGFNGLCDGQATPDRVRASLDRVRALGFLDEGSDAVQP